MLQGNSKHIHSKRSSVHENLEKMVLKHTHNMSQRPFAEHTQSALIDLLAQWGRFSQGLYSDDITSKPANKSSLILDACCGTARSTIAIAAAHPDCFVVGIDQSLHRLSKHNGMPENAMTLQANLLDLYRLMASENISLYKHYILYPNPWPKPGQLKRRWHAMPCFPDMLKLGGLIEVRSNWSVYVEEFAFALSLSGFQSEAKAYSTDSPITAFEEKYINSGHTLYYLQTQLT
jgi:tRNA G46 methylase TrmB